MSNFYPPQQQQPYGVGAPYGAYPGQSQGGVGQVADFCVPRKEADAGAWATTLLVGLIAGLIVGFLLARANYIVVIIAAIVVAAVILWFVHKTLFPTASAYYSNPIIGNANSQRMFDIVAVIVAIIIAMLIAAHARKYHDYAGDSDEAVHVVRSGPRTVEW